MEFISAMIVPTIIVVVAFAGLKEKKLVYNLFCDGAKDGIKITLKMFPTLIGIFLAVGMLRNSGFLDFIVLMLKGVTDLFNIPGEILPLALIKPISGSASIALATDIMTQFGVDSKIGMLAATIMGASETTFYVIAVYTNQIKVNNSGKVIIPAILADLTSIVTAIVCYKFMY